MKAKRQHQLMKYLIANEKSTIKQLAAYFNVSEMTIRRDLKHLENNQIIDRVNGEVTLTSFKEQTIPLDHRQSLNIPEKERIGTAAAELVSEGDVIIIDSGTTMQQLALNLLDKHDITVLTNDFNIIDILKKNEQLDLFFLGSKVHQVYDYTVTGPLSSFILQKFHVNKVFTTGISVDINSGLFTTDLETAQVKRSMLEVSQQVIVLADYSKFNSNSKYRIARIDEIDLIITDKRFGGGYLQQKVMSV